MFAPPAEFTRDHIDTNKFALYASILLKQLWDLRTKVLYAGIVLDLPKFFQNFGRSFDEHKGTLQKLLNPTNTPLTIKKDILVQ